MQEASALGAAILAGVATGVYNSGEDAIAHNIKVTNRFHPRPELSGVYDAQHATYKKLINRYTG